MLTENYNKIANKISLKESDDSNELAKYGIKELRDGLTLERIKSDFPWLLKASIKDAILGIFGKYDLCWYDGVWKVGTWERGTWENGTWNTGRWKSGLWNNGTWKWGAWEDGTFRGGDWLGGVHGKGLWLGGNWKGGDWLGGTWKKGKINGKESTVPPTNKK